MTFIDAIFWFEHVTPMIGVFFLARWMRRDLVLAQQAIAEMTERIKRIEERLAAGADDTYFEELGFDTDSADLPLPRPLPPAIARYV